MGTIITFRILFDFDDKNELSFWTNNEKAGNYDCETLELHKFVFCQRDDVLKVTFPNVLITTNLFKELHDQFPY